MDGLEESVRSAVEVLERIERDRDQAMIHSRRVIRLSKRIIHDIHLGESPDDHIDEIDEALDDLLSADTPDVMLSATVQDAMMEYAEAIIFHSLITDGVMPSASDLGISASAWILGMADCVGELRRAVTFNLMDGDMDGARKYYDMMEEICGQLMLLDISDGVAPIRRKQDIARGIMDRTRSDMTTAAVMRGL